MAVLTGGQYKVLSIPAVKFFCSCSQFHQRDESISIQRNLSCASIRLGACSADRESHPNPVNIFPSKSSDFTTPHGCIESEDCSATGNLPLWFRGSGFKELLLFVSR